MKLSPPQCSLCQSDYVTFYHQDKKRDYFQCTQCALVFVAPESFLTSDQEHAEYCLHENSFADEGYRQFLSRLTTPLLATLTPRMSGLDFGCGPAPVLAAMLEEKGFQMSVFDPYFSPDDTVLTRQYDFVTCTEAIEHFHNPATELATLSRMLQPGGILAVMTKRVISKERFACWHYKNDLTHVCFFSEATFDYIGRTYGYTVTFPAADVVFLQKEP